MQFDKKRSFTVNDIIKGCIYSVCYVDIIRLYNAAKTPFSGNLGSQIASNLTIIGRIIVIVRSNLMLFCKMCQKYELNIDMVFFM